MEYGNKLLCWTSNRWFKLVNPIKKSANICFDQFDIHVGFGTSASALVDAEILDIDTNISFSSNNFHR